MATASRPPSRIPTLPLLVLLPWASAAWAADASPKIVNGEAESGHPAVVSLGADFGSQRFSLCTGSIITTRIILTAAHCGADIPPEIIASAGRAYLGDRIDDPLYELRLNDMVLHPGYVPLQSGVGGQISENDFAVVILAEDSPVVPIPINWEPVTEDDVGREMLSVGYGASSGNGNGSGTKRSVTLVMTDYDEQFLFTNANRNPTEGNICSGDSGGPQLLQDAQGEWVQWAVHSWGYEGCGGLSASTRTDIGGDWLMEQIEAVHGSTDLCEVRGLYGDDICDEACEADPDCLPPLAALPGLNGTGFGDGSGGCSTGPARPSMLLVLLGLLGFWPRRRR